MKGDVSATLQNDSRVRPKQPSNLDRPSMTYPTMDNLANQPNTGETCISSMTSLTSSVRSLTENSSVSSVSSLDSLVPSNNRQDFPLSLFPCLDSRPGSDSNWQSTEVPFKDVDSLQSYCARNEVSTLAVFQIAWAFVLRCYLNESSVCFIYTSSKSKEGLDNALISPPHLGACQVDFEAEIPVFDILKRASMQCSGVPARPLKSHPLMGAHSNSLETFPMNTSLVYREENQKHWSGVVRPIITDEASASLINVCSYRARTSASSKAA